MDIKVNYQSSICINGELFFDPWHVEGGRAKVIFLTYDHYDHYSAEDINKLLVEGTTIVCPKCFAKDVQARFGCFVLAVEPGEVLDVCGMQVETFAAYNHTKPYHPKAKGYVGYVVLIEGKRVVVTGDTDVTPELLASRPDILLLPIGGEFTMDYRQAAEATNQLAPELVIPTHYGCVVGQKADGKRFKELVKPSISCQLLLG